MSGKNDGNSEDRTGRKEYRIAVINPKSFSASPITNIFMKGLLAEIFMLDTDVQPNLVKARCVHPDTAILRENKLYIEGITDS
jgi:hypothetical protein